MNPIPQKKKTLNKHAIEWLQQFTQEMDADPDLIDTMPIEDIRAELRRAGADDAIHVKLAKTLQATKHKRTSKPLVEQIALEFWEPRYAGRELVAADMARQEHEFQEGQIKINTHWEGARDDKPAYIWVGWEVYVQPPYHLHLRFIVPETGHILYEVNLGQTERNSESFKADELHFDPTTTRFGIIAFTETPL